MTSDTPGTRGVPGGLDRMLAVKRRKIALKYTIFSLWSFSEVGQKKKTEKKKRERLNDGNNNGQLCIANATLGGARKTSIGWRELEKINH